jgi:hypothetical protein
MTVHFILQKTKDSTQWETVNFEIKKNTFMSKNSFKNWEAYFESGCFHLGVNLWNKEVQVQGKRRNLNYRPLQDF